jgi:hypothetical protein
VDGEYEKIKVIGIWLLYIHILKVLRVI